MRYRLSEIARMCGGELRGVDCEVGEIVTDSRRQAFGQRAMFVAMRGENHDSHSYIVDMYRAGVRAFMTEHEVTLAADAGCVVVENAIEALQRMAAEHRARFEGVVVGITGSNGKTVVKEWTARSLPTEVKLIASPMSYNSQIGVALSLLMIEGDEQVALIEAGISERGEMERLEQMIRPDVVVVTSIGDAHQANFESLEQKIEQKLLLARSARKIIYHSAYEELARKVEQMGIESVDAARTEYEAQTCGEVQHINGQIVKTLCRELGYEQTRLEQPDVAMRLEVKEGIDGSTIINDSYNSDINSLALALDTLRSVALGQKSVAVVSDILQSGMSDEELYTRVAAMVEHAGVDLMIGVGERISRYADRFKAESRFFASTEQLMQAIGSVDLAGRTILLKGNRRSHFERVCHSLERRSHTTVLEVNLDAMTHNVGHFRSFLKMNHRLVAMVKAHSYGTGDVEVAQLMQHLGVSYLAVAFADEGVALREKGVKMPIVVLNADAGSFDQMVAYSLEPEIYSFHSLEDFVRSVERYGKQGYPIHIKLDTGMHRLGFVAEEAEELIERVKGCRAVRVASIFSHLSCADDPSQDDFTREQIALFDRVSSQIAEALPYEVLRHTANSAAIERFPEAAFDMCRLGLGLYGYGYCHNEELQPVATLKTRIVQLRHRSKGEAIGYGRSERLKRDSVVATIPIGYADGLDRHLGGGRWSVLVAGEKAATVGRICMDSCMIDVTDVEGVKEGDEVTIFSAAKGNTLEDMAEVLGTISYEIMTSISARVKRVYVRE
ncbi:MAG: alanine racemase [Rikenellaceae bacterium]|nr:alanine racemase [Rikenellaceae bacterium]